MSSNSRLPRITARRLLKSCASPEASWPTASSFCDWTSAASARSAFGRFGHQPAVRFGDFPHPLGDPLFEALVEVAQRRLGALFLGDVAGDLRYADNSSGGIAHRRDG